MKLSTQRPNWRGKWVLLLAAAAIAGCTDFEQLRDPTVSDLVLDSTEMSEINRINVPMPAQQPMSTPTRAESAGLWGKQTRSFFQDRRATMVGDLVTVTIDIDDQAQLRNSTERSREGSQSAENPTFAGSKLFTPDGRVVDVASEAESKGEGAIRRNEKIELRVAATIIKELPNGNLVIAGRQEVKVNYEKRELRIGGIVRPEDIALDNSIPHDKIAEARITYGGVGQISTMQRARYGEDLLEVILPY